MGRLLCLFAIRWLQICGPSGRTPQPLAVPPASVGPGVVLGRRGWGDFPMLGEAQPALASLRFGPLHRKASQMGTDGEVFTRLHILDSRVVFAPSPGCLACH